jgi:hypothetical protein
VSLPSSLHRPNLYVRLTLAYDGLGLLAGWVFVARDRRLAISRHRYSGGPQEIPRRVLCAYCDLGGSAKQYEEPLSLAERERPRIPFACGERVLATLTTQAYAI